jgi:hypothetical protein
VLRALSLCTCCRHYPGVAAGRRPRSSHPAVSAFPANVVGSACTSSFSRLLLPAGAVAGWGLHPLESAAFSRRTRLAVVADRISCQPTRLFYEPALLWTKIRRAAVAILNWESKA